MEEQFLPARNVLSIARHLVEARIAQAGGDWETATRHLTEAIELEGGIGYMEPPYWSYPVAQTLGALRLQASDPSGARKAFKAALATHPNNAWALWGLWQVEKVSGDRQSQDRAAAAFRRAWLGDGEPAINRL